MTKSVKSRRPGDHTSERILDATLEVLLELGPQKLSMSDVAEAAEVSRPTLYRRFASKEALLEAFSLYEEAKFDAGLAVALAGVRPADRLDAVLKYIVDFQHSYSLRHMVDVEPGHILQQMKRVLPIVRERLSRYFSGPDGQIVAAILTRVMLSHALLPDDDPAQFLAELRATAGLGRSKHDERRSAQQPAPGSAKSKT